MWCVDSVELWYIVSLVIDISLHCSAPKVQVLLPHCAATTDQPLWTERRDADTIIATSATSSIFIRANVSE